MTASRAGAAGLAGTLALTGLAAAAPGHGHRARRHPARPERNRAPRNGIRDSADQEIRSLRCGCPVIPAMVS